MRGRRGVTRDQFAEVFGRRQPAAAGTPGDESGAGAPSGSSAPVATEDADTATTTTPVSDEEEAAAGSVEADDGSPQKVGNDDSQGENEESDPQTEPEVSAPAHASSPLAEPTVDNDPPQSEVPAAANVNGISGPTNDNQPADPLSAAGTD